MDSDPPLHKAYETLFNKTVGGGAGKFSDHNGTNYNREPLVVVNKCDLPLIDLNLLGLGEAEREECKSRIARASQEWGFFQVVNHGISRELSEKMRSEQEKAFNQPFENKYQKFSAGCYRWGTPTATCLRQLSWSEAFHVPLDNIIHPGSDNAPNSLRYTNLNTK